MENNDIIKTIIELKKEKDAVILAHNYQTLEIQALADFVGDSLELAQKATEIKSKVILFCGVKFMAETAKLLNPKAKVLLSNIDAGCPMADMITGEQLKLFKERYLNSTVVCYVNSSIEVKAESDICCTSSNAVKVIESIDEDKTILFVPDQNLGTYVAHKTKRNIIVWHGFCPVHNNFISIDDVKDKKINLSNHTIIIHPESKIEVLKQADMVGSTKQIADFVHNNDNIIIGTEIGLYEQLKDKYPEKNLEILNEDIICEDMKRTTIDDVLNTLKNESNEIKIEPEIAKKALKSINNMLKLSKK